MRRERDRVWINTVEYWTPGESDLKGARAEEVVMWVRDKRMGRIARTRKRVPGGGLPHLMPIRRTSSTAAGNEARQVIHISSILPMRLSTSHRNCLDLSQLRRSTDDNKPIGKTAL